LVTDVLIVPEVLIPKVFVTGAKYAAPLARPSVRKITFSQLPLAYVARFTPAFYSTPVQPEGYAMINKLADKFTTSAVMRRASPVLAFGLLAAMAVTAPARAELATPEQKKACTPDVYRLCAGEIPNVRAITACLRRQKANLSEACRAVFEQPQ
jgi:hypothetical protein